MKNKFFKKEKTFFFEGIFEIWLDQGNDKWSKAENNGKYDYRKPGNIEPSWNENSDGFYAVEIEQKGEQKTDYTNPSGFRQAN